MSFGEIWRHARTLLAPVKARKIRYFGHIIRSNGSYLEKEIIQGILPGRRTREKPKISWIDNIKTRTGLEAEILLTASNDRLQWRSVVHDAANPRIEDSEGKARRGLCIGVCCL